MACVPTSRITWPAFPHPASHDLCSQGNCFRPIKELIWLSVQRQKCGFLPLKDPSHKEVWTIFNERLLAAETRLSPQSGFVWSLAIQQTTLQAAKRTRTPYLLRWQRQPFKVHFLSSMNRVDATNFLTSSFVSLNHKIPLFPTQCWGSLALCFNLRVAAPRSAALS